MGWLLVNFIQHFKHNIYDVNVNNLRHKNAILIHVVLKGYFCIAGWTVVKYMNSSCYHVTGCNVLLITITSVSFVSK